MGFYNDNIFDDTTFEFPRTGFWLIHLLGASIVFYMGMRFALRKCPFSRLGYRLVRMFIR